MADIELSDLEVPSWPVEAFQYEPVHGLFARFAERNGQTSTAVFARHVGINWTHPNLSELRNFCSKYPIQHWEKAVEATPTVESGKLIINGEILSPYSDWSIYQPRVCEGCLHEAAYYRNWWDVTAIHHCPIHDRPLVFRGNKSRLSLWYSRVGMTPGGENLAKFAPRVAKSGHTWERYVLGRFGVLQPAPNPMLDEVALYHVVEAVELLGTAALVAVQNKVRQRSTALSPERAAILSAGAPIALAGLGAISDCMHTYVELRQKALKNAGRQPSHPAIFRGRLAKLAEQSENPLFLAIRHELDRAIDHLKVYARRVKASAPLATRPSCVPFKKLATEMGLNKHQLRRLAMKLGLVAQGRAHGAYISLSYGAVELLKRVHSDLICRNDAASRSGLSHQEFDRVCKAIDLTPTVRFGRGRVGDHYQSPDLETIQKSLPGYLSQIDVRAKPKLPRGFKPRTISTRSGLSYADAAIELRVSPSTVTALIAGGYLSLVKNACSARGRLDTESINAFKARFAAAHLYADLLQCRPSSAYAVLKKLGITKLQNVSAAGASFMRRDDVCAALNVEYDPYEQQNSDIGQFWSEFMRHTAKQGRGAMRMFGNRNSECVRLYSGDRTLTVSFQVTRSNATIGYELVCDATKSPRRFDRLCRHLDEVRMRLGEDAINLQSDERIVVTGLHHCDLTSNVGWVAVFDWIESQMTYFRSIFTPKPQISPKLRASVRHLLATAPLEGCNPTIKRNDGLRAGSPPSPPRD